MSTPSHAEPDVELGEMTVAPAPTVVEELVADAQSSGSPAAPLSPTSAAAAAMTKSISAIEDTTSAHGASGTSGTPANAPKDATDVSGAPPAKPASFEELFGFADGLDRALLLMGLVFALGQGAVLPLMSQFFGDIIDAFVRREAGLISDSEFERLVNVNVVYFVILAVGAFVAAYIYNTAFAVAAERQMKRLRERYYEAILRQDIGWFDVNHAGALTTRITSDAQVIQQGISDKLALALMFIGQFVGGFVLAFVRGYKLALVLLAVIPVLVVGGALMGKFLATASAKEQVLYGKSGAVAEEVLSGIRTVTAYSAERFEIQRYVKSLQEGLAVAKKKGFINGATIGMVTFIIYAAYGLAFWYGSTLVAAEEMAAGAVVTTFFSVILGSMALGQAAPNLGYVFAAKGSMGGVLAIINRPTLIDSMSDSGRKLDKVEGRVELKAVYFSYPNRADVRVLNDFSLSIEPGTTTAVVGASGSGKSTVVQLLERFYDPISGQVMLDGVDLKDLNVRWLRKQIGLVSQEPTLFADTIKANIAYGKPGATHEEIECAAKLANAHSFISKLPQGYNTLAGEGGALLSGGQKQRLAIARALINDPKVLLLDEATAALDSGSEKLVQEALDRASKSRTTIVIAHRLSTIQKADNIVVVEAGKIVEMGTHAQLVSKRGHYYTLTQAQQLNVAKHEEQAVDESQLDDVVMLDLDASADPSSPEKSPLSVKKSSADDVAAKDTKLGKPPGIPWKDTPLPRIFALNRKELPLIALGAFGAAVNGSVEPLYAVIFTEMLNVFAKPEDEMLAGARFYALLFLALGAGSFIANIMQTGFFELSGSLLTTRIRELSYTSMLRQPIAWHDDDQTNAVGMLSSKLASEAGYIKGLTGQLLGVMLRVAVTLAVGFGIAFASCWQVTLIVVAILPILAGAQALQFRRLQGVNKYVVAYRSAAAVVTESVQAIRTVASLGAEPIFLKRYAETLVAPHDANVRAAWFTGAAAGVSQAVPYLAFGTAFYASSRFVLSGEYTFKEVNLAMMAVIFASLSLGQASTFMPDISKAKAAAVDLFMLMDRKSEIDPLAVNQGKKPAAITGDILISDVSFVYPRRPDATVFEGMTINVRAGETVALVGASGSGKSTAVWLVERFYDPQRGQVLIDGVDVKDLNVKWLREHIGLVTQEPRLFDLTVGENVAYSRMKEDPVTGDVTMDATHEEIVKATRLANIHDFIEGLPEKYNTRVGEKGTQLSGGQKQRIAIARALLRDPKILLLDEATSALDTGSEKLVQDALEKARQGRTTIIVAHRLSTIQNADRILVFAPGLNNEGAKIVEEGTHDELLQKRGIYHAFVQKQKIA